jgi:long-subunit fatty acid transport protein
MKYFVDLGWIAVRVMLFMVLFASYTHAQQTEFSSTLNPVGSGARATGMGGAFIGVADDATAASWNPAGLIQLEEPEVSAVYSYFHRKQTYSSDSHPEMNSTRTMDTDGLNYASIAYPFILLNRNMLISLNYQRLYEMNKEYRFPYLTPTGPSERTVSESGHEEFSQDGFLYTVSPALAVQVTPELYVGATFNIWDNIFGQNGWKSRSEQVQKKVRERALPVPLVIQTDTTTIRNEDNSFKGYNWHMGFLWSLTEKLTLGGVYKTPFEADFEKKQTVTQDVCFGAAPPGSPLNVSCTSSVDSSSEDFELDMPASYGLGLAYRHSDSLTLAIDVYMTNWERFVLRDSEENETNPLTGSNIREGRLKNTTQIRAGMEYLYVEGKNIIPLRTGVFYDPEPATGHVDDYYGFSFGTGLVRGRVVFDISYQYRKGNNVTSDFLTVPDSDPDIDQHTVMASLIFYLN